ncbi:uncharacterized protein C2845_PM06G32660 [Panicum miliaceum]|uniref:Uncharacterized protein n=1 Tax=Panicum miliaceum TaxID=4540 RepID=A0A3L6R948_PANMI|nr:uncharacterized protein C2845_PM06G32660 [Panicum miliaceum]
MSSTAASNLAGLWLAELDAAARGAWQAMASSHGERRRPGRQQEKLGAVKKRTAAVAVQGAAASAGKAAKEGDVGRCGGAMSDTTVFLLLDRFAPS